MDRKCIAISVLLVVICGVLFFSFSCKIESKDGLDSTGKHQPNTPSPRWPELLFTWEGQVDGQDLLKFQNDRCWIEHRRHLPITNMNFTIVRHLDEQSFPVILSKDNGRGKIKIIRQGDTLNAFTLLVEIDDLMYGGAGWYRFSVYKQAAQNTPQPVFYLYADVDDDVVIVLDRDSAKIHKVSGQKTKQFKYFFSDPENLDLSLTFQVKIIEGRGEVELLPREADVEEIKIRIVDSAKGSAIYQLALVPAE